MAVRNKPTESRSSSSYTSPSEEEPQRLRASERYQPGGRRSIRKQHCVVHGGGRRCQEEGCCCQLACKLAASGGTASRTEGAGAASTWAAPWLLLEVARLTARRMEGASAANKRAAPSQSLELPAVCTAGYVSSASSPTMRRTMHRNSVARPRRLKPRSWRIWCEDSTGDGAAHRLQ
jgi:hypothetical protein